MRPTALISVALPFFLAAAPFAAADSCTSTYNGYSCSGSVYGNETQGVSGLICCKGSSSCNMIIDGSITKCDSGTQIPLASTKSAAAALDVAGGLWKAVGAVAALTAGFVVVL